MKKWLMIPLLVIVQSSFSQSSTAQAMLKQIALLQNYIGWLGKGYAIARKGLNTISAIKDGHWKIDEVFFDRLRIINPEVAGYSKIAAITRLQAYIDRRCADGKTGAE